MVPLILGNPHLCLEERRDLELGIQDFEVQGYEFSNY